MLFQASGEAHFRDSANDVQKICSECMNMHFFCLEKDD